MKIIELDGRVIYKGDNDKKLKIVGQEEEYEEIVLKERNDELVVEVE